MIYVAATQLKHAYAACLALNARYDTEGVLICKRQFRMEELETLRWPGLDPVPPSPLAAVARAAATPRSQQANSRAHAQRQATDRSGAGTDRGVGAPPSYTPTAAHTSRSQTGAVYSDVPSDRPPDGRMPGTTDTDTASGLGAGSGAGMPATDTASAAGADGAGVIATPYHGTGGEHSADLAVGAGGGPGGGGDTWSRMVPESIDQHRGPIRGLFDAEPSTLQARADDLVDE